MRMKYQRLMKNLQLSGSGTGRMDLLDGRALRYLEIYFCLALVFTSFSNSV